VPKSAREMGRDSGALTQSQKEAMEKFIIKKIKSLPTISHLVVLHFALDFIP
jgi:hypothetical protein